MDVNGLRVWQVADRTAFGFARPAADAPQNLHWRSDGRLLRLDRQQAAPALAEDETFARAQAEKPSPVTDPAGSYAWWDSDAEAVVASGFVPGQVPLAVPPDEPPGVPRPTDLAFGADEVLYVARNNSVVMVDRRDRWRPARVALEGFSAQRLAPAAGGGAWVLDRTDGSLAHLTGYPLRKSGFTDDEETRFGPVDPNPRPPRLRVLRRARLPAGHSAVAVAASPGGQVAVLAWRAGQDAVLFQLEDRELVRRFALEGLRFPYAMAWAGEASVALIASDGARPAAQAYVYEMDSAPGEDVTARPTGAVHRLLDVWHGGFFNTLLETPRYPTADTVPTRPSGGRPLHALSRATYARSGTVRLGPFNSGEAGCIWHRLYLEASVPDKSGIRIWAFASDDGAVPLPHGEAEAPIWSPHLAGQAAALAEHPDAPVASWLTEESEMAFNPGLSSCPSEPDKSGLFTVLLQRAGRRVRRLRGRYLYLQLELIGDSQVTPQVASARVYAHRFSYRDRYLPALYGETLSGPDADAAAAATAPDFLDRFLGLFEGPLTQLEEKIASSWLLTDPAAAPDDALPWLARWIGIDPDHGGSARQLRQSLLAAPWTARLHGTLGGMLAALEIATGGVVVSGGRVDPHRPVPRPGKLAIATLGAASVRALVLNVTDPRSGGSPVFLSGGAVTRGEIVIVEGFRLRRTFATILGADLADEDDPLTGGLAASGNSFVGDTLILGDETRREFLALFSADLPLGRRDRQAVARFFAGLAHRVLVLVRKSARTMDQARLVRVATEAAPAHAEVSVLEATRPLIVAAASLVGIDTFLVDDPGPGPVRIGRSRLGLGDQIRGAGRLDPRADCPVSPPPVALADGPAEVPSGSNFILSAARSRAAEGRHIERNIWMWT